MIPMFQQVNLVPVRWAVITDSRQETEFYTVLVTVIRDSNLFLDSCHVYLRK